MALQHFEHRGFRITSKSAAILKAGPIDAMTSALGIAPPEMIFGHNFMRIEHGISGWGIEFNAFDALDMVDKTGEKMLSVAYGQEWQESRKLKEDTAEIKPVTKPFDWSYTTAFKGATYHTSGTASNATEPDSRLSPDSMTSPDFSRLTLTEAASPKPDSARASISEPESVSTPSHTNPTATPPRGRPKQDRIDSSPPYASVQGIATYFPAALSFQPSNSPLPLHLLSKPDPILHFLTLDIYEDELADNGLALLNIKLRVMPSRLLLLQRFFMRLDDVIFRVRDTRLYIEFGSGVVMREYVEKEGTYSHVKAELEKKCRKGGGEVSEGMRDGGRVSEVLTEQRMDRELLTLGGDGKP